MEVSIIPTEIGVLLESNDPEFKNRYGAGLLVKPEHLFNFYNVIHGIDQTFGPVTFLLKGERSTA